MVYVRISKINLMYSKMHTHIWTPLWCFCLRIAGYLYSSIPTALHPLGLTLRPQQLRLFWTRYWCTVIALKYSSKCDFRYSSQKKDYLTFNCSSLENRVLNIIKCYLWLYIYIYDFGSSEKGLIHTGHHSS